MYAPSPHWLSLSDFLDRLGPVPRRVSSFWKFLLLREEVLIEERGGAGAGRGEGACRARGAPIPPLQVLLPAERARGTHQIVCPLGACNGMTRCPPHRSPINGFCWALSQQLSWPGLAFLAGHSTVSHEPLGGTG